MTNQVSREAERFVGGEVVWLTGEPPARVVVAADRGHPRCLTICLKTSVGESEWEVSRGEVYRSEKEAALCRLNQLLYEVTLLERRVARLRVFIDLPTTS